MFYKIIYGILLVIGVMFCISNAQLVRLYLFPFGYVMEMPQFLLLLLFFLFGAITGWLLRRRSKPVSDLTVS